MSDFETITYELKEHIGVLTLNRPERVNAINEKMITELEGFWAARRHDDDTRVIVFSGAGEKGFCAGIDLVDTSARLPEADIQTLYRMQARVSRLLLAMRQAPQPIIGAIHGAAVGGGLSFALGCCIRLIAPDTRFAASYINIGLGGADCGSSYFLPRMIGAGRAYEFLLTGDFMGAEDALGLGMVSRAVPKEKLMDEAMELARKMCRKNPLGLMLTKEAVNHNLDAAGLEHALAMEDRNQALCLATIRYEGQAPDTR